MNRLNVSFPGCALLFVFILWGGNARGEQVMEEIVVQARLKSLAESLMEDRIRDQSVTDVLDAEMISRAGDSTVAAALRRISGLSLVNDKYVYVRGLGERYSSSTLNGAFIPSPDLSRNVIPLDIFPTAIVESLSIQKSYSSDRPASFGGGNVDIRTKGLPDSLVWSVEVSSGGNSEASNLISYQGGGKDWIGTDDGTRALSRDLQRNVARFRGALGVQSILGRLRKEGNADVQLQDARDLNRQLALDLNRNLSIDPTGGRPDLGVRTTLGNNFLLGNRWEFGFLTGVGYDSKWRRTETIARNFRFPEERFEKEAETTRTVDANALIDLGARFTDDHEIRTTSLFLQNTDDETALIDYFNENREKSDGIGFRDTRIKFEERRLMVNDVRGTHYLGEETRKLLPWISLNFLPETFRIDWQYTDSRAMTDIPNEVNISSETVTDSVTGAVESSAVMIDSAAADYRFTSLRDDVVDYDWRFLLPVETENMKLEISGGSKHTQKSRTYRQLQFSLGPLNVADPTILSGPLGSVFSDANIMDPANDFVLDLSGTNNQSYIAATMTDAVFGNVDWSWKEKWRVALGARWEVYRQVALDWNINAYSIVRPQVSADPEVLANSVFEDEKIYPSFSLTYMGELWAETFQLRFGYSETVVRPDLREITDASYIDARTGFLTDGDPSVRPAELTNYDLRAEWFFQGGDNVTLSFFYKDIANPIEFFESAASDTNRAREIINAKSGKLYGMEMEVMKNLRFLGAMGESLFVQGNFTLMNSELVAGERADAPTNSIRSLAGASDYVVNLMLGFDSFNGKHSATLSYNVFGERLFAAGRRGSPDLIEQPFNSLDFTWSWYPTEQVDVRLRARNLLDQSVLLKQAGTTVFSEKPGLTLDLTVNWSL